MRGWRSNARVVALYIYIDMQARQHRGAAGNGYRSSPAAGLVVSGHGSHSSDHRTFNRSSSFGLPKPYQSATPRRGDVFMEAGRLAAEYLVSQGLLPGNALPMKWKAHVASSKKREGDLQGFRPQEAQEGRTSALARLGNFVPDAGASSGKRRFTDEYNSSGYRDQFKARRRLGHSRSYDSNSSSSSSRLNGKRALKAESSLDMEGDVHSASGNQEQRKVGRGMVEPLVSELAPKTDAGDLESKSESNQIPEITAPEISTGAHKDLPLVTDEDVSKMGDDSGALTTETGELVDDTANDEVEKQCPTESLPVQHCAVEEGDQKMTNCADLKTLCRFVNVPTRTRSSLVHKVSKVESLSITEVDSTPDVKSQGSAESVLDFPSVDKLTNPIQSSKCQDSDISKTLTVDSEEVIGKMSPAYPKEQEKCFESHSFPQGSMLHQHEDILEPPGFGRSTSLAERGDRQASNHSDTGGETNKSREWLPSIVTQDNEYIRLSNLREKEASSPEERSLHVDNTVAVADNDTSMDISLFPTSDNELCLEYAEEKQHFPSLFKICDLNLMQASNVNENGRSSDPNLIYPLNSETKSEAASADIHLPTNESCNISDEHVGPAADGKEIEIIDLENGSPHGDNVLSNSETKEETLFASVGGFPNNLQPSSGINDVHDGYGLMVSDFLGTDIGDCSSVPADFNSLHNEMSLHSGEVPALPQNMDIRDLFNINMSYLDTWDF